MDMSIYTRFDHMAIVPDQRHDDPIELWVCNRCGSVIRGISMEIHDDWHMNLESLAKLAIATVQSS